MKREDEELCKSIFDQHLLALFDRSEVRWTEVSRSYEPPDFYLEIAGANYAVEVTSLVEKTSTPLRDGVSVLDFLFPIKEMVDRLAASAKKGGHLSGGYVVVIGDPIDDFAKIRTRLESGLLSYIQNTQSSMMAPEQVIFRLGNQQCKIAKIHDEVDEIRLFWNGELLYAAGIAEEMCSLLQKVLQRKTDRLRRLRLPKILLLRDLCGFGKYGFSNAEIGTRCSRSLTNALSAFCVVFVIRDDREGLLFYPEESKWNKSLFVHALI